MTTLTAQADGPVEAPAALVLEIIRDFDGHHRQILPKAFSDFRVVSGGVGAGTVTSFALTMGGRTTHGQTVASEPEPGVVREDVVGTDMVTTFRVEPRGDGASFVTIRTTWTPSGLGERLFAAGMLSRIYRDEVRLLQAFARGLNATRHARAVEDGEAA
jgi:hypothetical protein